MSLSKAMLERLNSEDEPLPKRLKLAKTALMSVDTPFVQQDLILNWLYEICLTDKQALKTLKKCLLHIPGCMKVNTITREHIIMIFKNLPATENLLYTINTLCDLITCCNIVRQTIVNDPYLFGNIIIAFLRQLLTRYNQYTVKQAEHNQLFELCPLTLKETYYLIKSIESIMIIHKHSISTKEEIKNMFMKDILYPVCSLINCRTTDSTNKLGAVTYKCIQQLLLGKKKHAQNKQITEDNRAIFSDLFLLLSAKVEIENLQTNLLTYMFIFRTAISTYKSNIVLLDVFFRNLIESSGKYKWEVLCGSLKLLSNVTLDFENTINGVTLSEYFQKCIDDILTGNHITSTHCEILEQFSYINPHLTQKNISDILDKISMEKEYLDYTKLLIALLYASTKLRREQKFISQLLRSLKVYLTKQEQTCNMSIFFPQIINVDSKFGNALAKSIRNISGTEAIASLKTLIYHLNTDCVELLQDDISYVHAQTLKTIIGLLIIFLDNVQFFYCTGVNSSPMHKKFVNTIDELRNTLSLLINKALCFSYNPNIIETLLTAVDIVCEIQNILKHYMPEITKTLLFPIQDDSWHILIQRVRNFGESTCKFFMNKLILYRMKKNISEAIELDDLIGGLEYSWNIILIFHPDILSLLTMNEIRRIAYLLLMDMLLTSKKYYLWLRILDEEERIQENVYFIECFWQQICSQIKQCFSLECTSFKILEYIETKLFVEDKPDIYRNDRLTEVLQFIQKRISRQKWIQVKFDFIWKLISLLNIFPHIPVTYLNPNVKTLLFLVLYSISKECNEEKTILTSCKRLFFDLLKDTGVDVFQYIKPIILIKQLEQIELPTSLAFRKACEFYLRGVTSYDTLKDLIEDGDHSHYTRCILVDLFEDTKPYLDSKQKVIFEKAQNHVAEVITKLIQEQECSSSHDICLYTVLKVTYSAGQLTNFVKRITKSFFREKFSFLLEEVYNIRMLTFYEMEIASIVIKQPKRFGLKDKDITNMWYMVLRYPQKSLCQSLVTSISSVQFSNFIKILYNETISSLLQKNKMSWLNMIFIWQEVMRANMSVICCKIYSSAIKNLFEIIHLLDVSGDYWFDLLRLLHDIVGAKKVLICEDMLQLILVTSLEYVETDRVSWQIVFALCITLLKNKNISITNSLPSFLLLYRSAIRATIHKLQNSTESDEQLKSFAFDIEEVASLLINQNKNIISLSTYLIADLLQLIADGTITSFIKVALQNSLYHLLSICDQHGIALLSRTLPTSLQEIFKVQLDMFKKFHKYSGEI